MPKHADQQIVDSPTPPENGNAMRKRTTRHEPRCALRWTAEDDAFIERNYKSMTEAAMATALGRSRPAVHHRRLKILWLPKTVAPKRWSEENEAMLEELYGEVPHYFLAAVLCCSANALWQHAWDMGLRSPRFWSHEEDEILRKHFPSSSMAEFAKLLPDRSPAGIYRRARALSIPRGLPYLLGSWRYTKFKSYPPELQSLIRLHNHVERKLQDVQAQH